MDMHGEGVGEREGSGEGESRKAMEGARVAAAALFSREDHCRHCPHKLPGFQVEPRPDGSEYVEQTECCYCGETGKIRHGKYWHGQP